MRLLSGCYIFDGTICNRAVAAGLVSPVSIGPLFPLTLGLLSVAN